MELHSVTCICVLAQVDLPQQTPQESLDCGQNSVHATIGAVREGNAIQIHNTPSTVLCLQAFLLMQRAQVKKMMNKPAIITLHVVVGLQRIYQI